MNAPIPAEHPARALTLRPVIPTTLTVVYDDGCELCRRCRAWLEGAEQLVTIDFAPASDADRLRELGLDPMSAPAGDELIVIGDNGAVWIGADAFITCLWALKRHRRLAARLQKPTYRPVAKRAFHALSAGRGTISLALSARTEPGQPLCTGDTCQTPPTVAHPTSEIV